MMHPTTDNFTLIGINHWDAPVEIRERFSLDESRKRLFLDAARREGIHSIFVVSTCNRTEIIANDASAQELIRLLTN